jgi:hypothetical protein
MTEQRDYEWVKIRSWHAVETPTRMFNTYKTMCGQRATGTRAEGTLTSDLPGPGKSCERCLKKIKRQDEAAAKAELAETTMNEPAPIGAGVGAVPVEGEPVVGLPGETERI